MVASTQLRIIATWTKKEGCGTLKCRFNSFGTFWLSKFEIPRYLTEWFSNLILKSEPSYLDTYLVSRSVFKIIILWKTSIMGRGHIIAYFHIMSLSRLVEGQGRERVRCPPLGDPWDTTTRSLNIQKCWMKGKKLFFSSTYTREKRFPKIVSWWKT